MMATRVNRKWVRSSYALGDSGLVGELLDKAGGGLACKQMFIEQRIKRYVNSEITLRQQQTACVRVGFVEIF